MAGGDCRRCGHRRPIRSRIFDPVRGTISRVDAALIFHGKMSAMCAQWAAVPPAPVDFVLLTPGRLLALQLLAVKVF
jgi:hypothetical protein